MREERQAAKFVQDGVARKQRQRLFVCLERGRVILIVKSLPGRVENRHRLIGRRGLRGILRSRRRSCRRRRLGQDDRLRIVDHRVADDHRRSAIRIVVGPVSPVPRRGRHGRSGDEARCPTRPPDGDTSRHGSNCRANRRDTNFRSSDERRSADRSAGSRCPDNGRR